MMLGDDLQVDLVPAFGRDAQGGGFYIPDGFGGWRQTNPLYHHQLVANSDQRLNGRLRPVIRVMKAWNLANGRHLRSFHLEMMVERMWQKVAGLPAMPDAVASTLKAAASWAAAPFADPWDAPQKIDSYLTEAERDLVVRYFDVDAANAAKAISSAASGQQATAVDLWDAIFNRKVSSFH
jgi:hypothetical protein